MDQPKIPGAAVAEVVPISIPVAPGAELPAPMPDEESCKKVREMALRQLNRFISYEPRVLKGDDADAIHDMRVASRRLQQVLDLLYPKPRPHELRQLRRKIRRCRQALGEVRNCDVLLEFVGRALARKRAARREAWTAVQHFLLVRRAESLQRTLRLFGKINPTGFYVTLKGLLHQQKAHAPAADHRAHSTAAPTSSFALDLAHALELNWGRFEDKVAESHHDSRPEVIHGARIATKRLRYLIEVFHEFNAPGSADALVWLRGLQKNLGDWHDLVVLEQMMIEMLARTEFLRDHLRLAMEVEKLILQNREYKADLEEKYARMSHGQDDMQRIKDWIAYFVSSPSAALVKV